MIQICRNNHDEIVSESGPCPLCTALFVIKQRDEEIADLKEQIEDMSDEPREDILLGNITSLIDSNKLLLEKFKRKT